MPTESRRTDTPPQNKWHNPWTIMVRTLVTISGAPNCLRGTAVKTLHKQTCCSFTLHSSLTRRLGQFVLLGHAIILLGLQQKWVGSSSPTCWDERENPFFGHPCRLLGAFLTALPNRSVDDEDSQKNRKNDLQIFKVGNTSWEVTPWKYILEAPSSLKNSLWEVAIFRVVREGGQPSEKFPPGTSKKQFLMIGSLVISTPFLMKWPGSNTDNTAQ